MSTGIRLNLIQLTIIVSVLDPDYAYADGRAVFPEIFLQGEGIDDHLSFFRRRMHQMHLSVDYCGYA